MMAMNENIWMLLRGKPFEWQQTNENTQITAV